MMFGIVKGLKHNCVRFTDKLMIFHNAKTLSQIHKTT